MSLVFWRKVVDFDGVADRIAFQAANDVLEKIGWIDQPVLFLESFLCEKNFSRETRSYAAFYPLFGDRSRRYEVQVVLKRDGLFSEHWSRGEVLATHLTGLVVLKVNLTVSWEEGTPQVTLGGPVGLYEKKAQRKTVELYWDPNGTRWGVKKGCFMARLAEREGVWDAGSTQGEAIRNFLRTAKSLDESGDENGYRIVEVKGS